MIHQNLLLPFIQNNWIWIACFIAAVGYYFFFEFQNIVYRKYRVSPQKVVDLINKESAQVLDLRPKKFFDDAHIADALNIEASKLIKENSVVHFDKTKPVILFSGYESDGKKVLPILQKQNFEKIYILSGGALEWKRLNYPFVSSNSGKKSKAALKSKKAESKANAQSNQDGPQKTSSTENKNAKTSNKTNKTSTTKLSKATVKATKKATQSTTAKG